MRVAKQKSGPCKGQLCKLLGFSRQALHKFHLIEEKEAFQQDLVVEKIRRIRQLQPKIGGRKLFHMLRADFKQSQIKLGRDGFFDLLRAHFLLVRRRRRRTRTTDSDHAWKKYPNLIEGFVPESIHRLWVSDITYILIGNTFGYLCLVTDAYSRKIVGFFLSPNLKASGCIKALENAIKSLRDDMLCLIHHSDRGIQYCSSAYVNILNQNGISISMTQNGDPRENALAERVNGILKGELLKEAYSDFKEAEADIAKAVTAYNTIRPHSSIGYLTPYQLHTKPELKAPQKWKSYYPSHKNKPVSETK